MNEILLVSQFVIPLFFGGIMTEPTMLDAIIKAAKKRIPCDHYRVILFGSRAGKTARPNSDYDIAIDAGQDIPLSAIARLEDDLESFPTLTKIDLVDLRRSSPEIALAARSEGRVIHEQ